MKKSIMLIAAMCMTSVMTFAQKVIRVSTDKTDLVMKVSPKGRLYQVYLGDKFLNPADYDNLKWDVYAASDGAVCQRGHEVYATSGAEDFFEPAVAVTHADGNMTTYLYYQSSEQKAVKGGTETVITLKDKVYPLTVKLHYVAYAKENVIKAWSEISHNEKSPVTLWRYSSTMLYFKSSKYYLTNYHSDWAKEGQPETTQLSTGKKIIDTKLGTRAAMQAEPFFELGFDEPAKENEGKVMLGTIGWPGNFRFTFEVDNVGALRVIPAINPYASDYKLKAGEVFTTPEFIFAMSDNGMGEASRNLHDWARQYQVNMGMDDRLTLLNNWENTGFDFNQQSLAELMKDAKDLGVDMLPISILVRTTMPDSATGKPLRASCLRVFRDWLETPRRQELSLVYGLSRRWSTLRANSSRSILIGLLCSHSVRHIITATSWCSTSLILRFRTMCLALSTAL